ncbi:LysR family transcriptional regulator [Tateyamaria sp. ANG-S1]|uniref:LysR family transcriptional regulator n=1 Tax=Tateyamaria sp. ANG-S1 TaxID=1577905 RepID=UPI00057C70C9|nr:LysR family transcriptional regulator [Tateyamaria sp. ANG-S1]KIC46229.1 LysR family transcriptional regulator [Tateyamaria sp. ANG-S1]
MDTVALRTLQLVVRHQSFAAVARVLDVDPSSVSRTVAGLEAQLGLRLFQRSTRQLTLTEAGALYLDRIGPLLDDLDLARDAAAEISAQPSGHVRLTASVAFGQEVLVPQLAALRRALPEIVLELTLSDQTVDLVAGQIDLAIRLAPAPKGDLISARLMSTRYRVVAAPSYLQAHGATAAPEGLADRPCLRMTLPEYRTEWRFRQGSAETVVGVDGPLLISNALALRAAAREGLGPALLADWMTDGDLERGTLVDLFPEHEVTATTFDTGAWLLYPSRAYLPTKVRAVIDFLRARLR